VSECLPSTWWAMHRVLGRGGMGLALEVGKGQHFRAAMKVLRAPPAGRTSVAPDPSPTNLDDDVFGRKEPPAPAPLPFSVSRTP
jgi:hypothetical protein